MNGPRRAGPWAGACSCSLCSAQRSKETSSRGGRGGERPQGLRDTALLAHGRGGKRVRGESVLRIPRSCSDSNTGSAHSRSGARMRSLSGSGRGAVTWGSPIFTFLHHSERAGHPHSPPGCPALSPCTRRRPQLTRTCHPWDSHGQGTLAISVGGGWVSSSGGWGGSREGGPLVAGKRRSSGSLSQVRTVPLWLQTCTLLSQHRIGLNRPLLRRRQVSNTLLPGHFSRRSYPNPPSIPHSAGTAVTGAHHPVTSQGALRPSRVVSWGCSWPTGRTPGQLRGSLVLPSLHFRL